MSTSRWYVLVSILFLLSTIVQAQKDSLEIYNKIMNSEESDQMFIQRTRNFIFTSLKSAKISEAKQAYNYAVDKYENEFTKPFWIDEKFLFAYWFGKYEILFQADSIENAYYNKITVPRSSGSEYLYPHPDNLAMQLRYMTNRRRSKIIQLLDSLVVNEEKYDYLVLFFDWLTFNATDPVMSEEKQEEYLKNNLTPRAEEFLSFYKSSVFRPFVFKHFRYVFNLSNWGFGYDLGLGSLIPDGKSAEYLKPEILLGLDLDISWKNIWINLGYDIGIPVAIRKPFIYKNKNWETNVSHNYYTYYISPGFVVQETEFLKLIPNIGIGGIHMSVSEGDKDKVEGDFSMTEAVLKYGITCDFKFSRSESNYQKNIYSYTGLRIGLDYFQFLGNNPVMSGGMLRFRILWVGFARSIFRDI